MWFLNQQQICRIFLTWLGRGVESSIAYNLSSIGDDEPEPFSLAGFIPGAKPSRVIHPRLQGHLISVMLWKELILVLVKGRGEGRRAVCLHLSLFSYLYIHFVCSFLVKHSPKVELTVSSFKKQKHKKSRAKVNLGQWCLRHQNSHNHLNCEWNFFSPSISAMLFIYFLTSTHIYILIVLVHHFWMV